MAKTALDSVDNQRGISPSGWGRVQSFNERGQEEILDCVPSMPSTVLGLEMLLGGSCVDLRAASELVSSDIGATIHVLRLVGREYGMAIDRPSRIGECLSGLAVAEWFEAIARRSRGWGHGRPAPAAAWLHCHHVAQYAQFVAESMESVSPEDAYLVGLLHGVDEIPGLLVRGDGTGRQERGVHAALEGVLPLFVLDALRRANDPCSTSPWRFILNTAHELAGAGDDLSLCGANGVEPFVEWKRGLTVFSSAGTADTDGRGRVIF